MSTFSCQSCGSPGIKLPADFNDATIVECEGCGLKISTWLDFKRLAHDAVPPPAPRPAPRGSAAAPDTLVITRRAVRLRWAVSR